MYHHRAGWLCSPQKGIEVMEKAVQYSWINNQWESLEEAAKEFYEFIIKNDEL